MPKIKEILKGSRIYFTKLFFCYFCYEIFKTNINIPRVTYMIPSVPTDSSMRLEEITVPYFYLFIYF